MGIYKTMNNICQIVKLASYINPPCYAMLSCYWLIGTFGEKNVTYGQHLFSATVPVNLLVYWEQDQKLLEVFNSDSIKIQTFSFIPC